MRKVTGCKIKFNKKKGCFILEISNKSKNGWEGTQIGAKIYFVDGYLIHTSWGSGIPIAVYKDKDDMITKLKDRYNVTPEFIS